MKTANPLKSDAALLAHLLERLEQRPRIDADAYRALVARLAHELDHLDDADALDAVLRAFPAAAAVYENMRYEHAGLCRASIDASLATEQLARAAISRAMREPRAAVQGDLPTGQAGDKADVHDNGR